MRRSVSVSAPVEANGRSQPSLRGFTLIELLVVISIIALLAGILLPSLAKGRALGKKTACLGNLHAAGTAFAMYLNENGDVMPNAAPMATENDDNWPLLVDVLGPCLSAPEVLLCPDDEDRHYFITDGSSFVYTSDLYNEGRQYTDNDHVQRRGVENIEVLNEIDKNDHKGAGDKNILYLDWHVEE